MCKFLCLFFWRKLVDNVYCYTRSYVCVMYMLYTGYAASEYKRCLIFAKSCFSFKSFSSSVRIFVCACIAVV